MPGDRTENTRFNISVPLFSKRSPFTNSKPSQTSYKPHPWIFDAVKDSARWMVNPDRPSLMVLKKEDLIELSKDTRPKFSPGDVIWYSFTLSFIVGSTFWYPEYRPIELVRVGELSGPMDSRRESTDFLTDVDRKPLAAGGRFKLPTGEYPIYI